MSVKEKLLFVDDEPKLLQSLVTIFEDEGYDVFVASTGMEGERLYKQEKYDLVLTDLRMPDISGMELLKRLMKFDPQAAVILITGYGTVESAVEAMKLGALDYITKPYNPDEMRLKIKRTLESLKLKMENVALKEKISSLEKSLVPIYKSEKMKEVYEQIDSVASSDVTVLLTGASGSGKEVAARYIHGNSKRANGQFMVVNCTVLPENLIESELFGHERGAFTGAVKQKVGKFELADGGTLFLDEIGELPGLIQSKLLRFIQFQQFERVGGTKSLMTNVRIITATNKDLEQEVKDKRFREDLYYRLSVIPIHIPSLKDRKEDILLLANHFFEVARNKYGTNAKRLSKDAEKMLLEHPWPGNVRELENAIDRAAILGKKEELRSIDFSFLKATPLEVSDYQGLSLSENEKRLVELAMTQTKGNILKAAELLEISRTTLYSKLEKHRISQSAFEHK